MTEEEKEHYQNTPLDELRKEAEKKHGRKIRLITREEIEKELDEILKPEETHRWFKK